MCEKPIEKLPRKSYRLLFTAKEHAMLKEMAYAYYTSMAEIVRRAIWKEWREYKLEVTS